MSHPGHGVGLGECQFGDAWENPERAAWLEHEALPPQTPLPFIHLGPEEPAVWNILPGSCQQLHPSGQSQVIVAAVFGS